MLPESIKIYYQALLEKSSEYEGIFYVGVKTTGVFCRPTCPARKPKFENCEFFRIEWLTSLITVTAAELPLPKKKLSQKK